MLDYKKLMEKANEMRKTSYAPYSHFRVGAVLVTKEARNTQAAILKTPLSLPQFAQSALLLQKR